MRRIVNLGSIMTPFSTLHMDSVLLSYHGANQTLLAVISENFNKRGFRYNHKQILGVA